MKQFEREALM